MKLGKVTRVVSPNVSLPMHRSYAAGSWEVVRSGGIEPPAFRSRRTPQFLSLVHHAQVGLRSEGNRLPCPSSDLLQGLTSYPFTYLCHDIFRLCGNQYPEHGYWSKVNCEAHSRTVESISRSNLNCIRIRGTDFRRDAHPKESESSNVCRL